MSWTDHDHHGEYADTQHGHGFYELLDVAEVHHRHYDTESEVSGLREDLGRAQEHIRNLEDRHASLLRALRQAAVMHEVRQRAGLADEAGLAPAGLEGAWWAQTHYEVPCQGADTQTC